jgi:putative ATP-dependent endonuclease of the OLD family
VITRLKAFGYKTFENFSCNFGPGLNIIVGDNDSGKTTILEAINLVLTGSLYGKSIFSEVSPYLFNATQVVLFLEALKSDSRYLPEIVLELYLEDNNEFQRLKGIHNTEKEDVPGIALHISLNQLYEEEFKELVSSPEQVSSVPSEFYCVHWTAFSGNPVNQRTIKFKSTFIDASSIRFSSGSDKYIGKIINDTLNQKEQAKLSIHFKNVRHKFKDAPEIKAINENLKVKSRDITRKEFVLSIDTASKSSWDSFLIPYLDEIPFTHSGMGEQSKLKIGFALSADADVASIFLIEEPENHLSFSNMSILLDTISSKCQGKQVIVTTHSNFVINKLGMDCLLLLRNKKVIKLTDIKKDTVKYFKKLPGFDTLRILLSNKTILVEGPTEELLIQRAYRDKYFKMPLAEGVDIMSVGGIRFKRFLDIAAPLKIQVNVFIDNDGKPESIPIRYKEYLELDHIKIIYESRKEFPTIEYLIVEANTLDNLNLVLNKSFSNKEDGLNWMLDNKTEWALLAFESVHTLNLPQYIKDGI